MPKPPIPFSKLSQAYPQDDDDEALSPSITGEESVSGDTPDPESDDDTLENAHDVGLGLDEDYDDPQPLDIAKDVEEAERLHRDEDPE
jgi:hypothetical protein